MSKQTDSNKASSIEVKTLVLTAAAAVVAAVVTQALWGKGALISTALTPVIIALVREGLDRPTSKITKKAARITAAPTRGAAVLGGGDRRTERPDGTPTGQVEEDATRPTQPVEAPAWRVEEPARVPVGAGPVGPPPPFDDTRSYDSTRPMDPDEGYEAPTAAAPATAAGTPAEPRIYGRRRFRLKHALLTAAAAFAIAVAALTIPELVLGESVGGGDRTTLFGGEGRGGDSDRSGGGGEEGSGESDGSEGSESESGSGESAPAPEDAAPAPEEEAEPAPEEEAPEAEPVAPQESAPSPSGSAQPPSG